MKNSNVIKYITNKKFLFLIAALFSIVIIITFAIDNKVSKDTRNDLFSEINLIPKNKVALLLGTSKFLSGGRPNQYFRNRIDATLNLYNNGKIQKIVISGDNSRKDYNEPQDMKNELVKKGIPANNIYLDYAGFNTYDSVIRMREIFSQNSFTVISQEFHNERAIYIAKSLEMKVIGFNAKDVDVYNGFKTKVREKLARVKMFLDIFTNRNPKFLGKKIQID